MKFATVENFNMKREMVALCNINIKELMLNLFRMMMWIWLPMYVLK